MGVEGEGNSIRIGKSLRLNFPWSCMDVYRGVADGFVKKVLSKSCSGLWFFFFFSFLSFVFVFFFTGSPYPQNG